ncbi:Lactonase, 7-bladed beta-propeller-domain-containing protein, partial [Microdochium trichocladiopsis]
QAVSQKLLVGAPGQILTYDLSGKQFTLTSKYAEAGTASSWMLPRGGDSDQLYAVNENADDLRLFGFADKVIAPGATPTKFTGSTGVVSLAFNADKTRLLGGGYSNGEVDVWNSEAADGSLTLIKTLKLTGALGPQQTSHRAHQVLLDPTGQFFAVPDLGGDQVVLVDARADKYELVGTTVPTGAGTGPRHGQFIGGGGGADGAPATHYVVVTELSNELILYKLTYTSAGISFAEVDRQTTIPAGTPQPIDPAGAAAGEVQVVGATDVYASNRRTGLPTGDSIVFFKLDAASNKLVFKQLVQSGGVFPRHFSFDAQGEVMFVANQ